MQFLKYEMLNLVWLLMQRKDRVLFFLIFIALLIFSSSAFAGEWGLKVRDASEGPGAEVTRVTPGKPAEKAGLKRGDIILEAEGKIMSGAKDFARVVKAIPAGKLLAIRISRGGWEKSVTLYPLKEAVKKPKPKKWFGLKVADQPANQAPGHGARITSVIPGGPADKAGLKAGDIITHIERHRIGQAKDFVSLVKSALSGKILSVTVLRDGWSKAFFITPGVKPEITPRGTAIIKDKPQNDLSEAEILAREHIAKFPEDPDGYGQLGLVYAQQNRCKQAIEAFQKALELGSPKVWILHNLGYCYFKLGNLSESELWLKRAIELDPKYSLPYIGLFHIYHKQKNWKEAEKYCKRALEKDPKNQMIWEFLAVSYEKQKRFSTTIATYRKALEVGPPSIQSYYGLGFNLYMEKRYAESEKALQEALKLDPNQPKALLQMGTTLAEQKKIAQAQKYWQRCLELDPDGPMGRVAKQNLAMVGFAGSLKGLTGPIAGRPDGLKATATVGDFQVKAATAGQFIGDGLREMLLTTLHNSGYFIVLERIDIKGLAAEQALSRSAMAKKGSAIARGQMDVADIMVYGTVTEFEAEARGSGMQMGVPQVPFTMGGSQKEAAMAVDIRVVDVATGRLLAAQRIPGSARSAQATFGTSIPIGKFNMPMSFSLFRNTPMERAIRDCVQKATYYVINNIPKDYFKHK